MRWSRRLRQTALAAPLALAVVAPAAHAEDAPAGAPPTYSLVSDWGKLGGGLPGEPEALDPSAVAVGIGGEAYVADTGNDRIVVSDADGQVVRTIGESGTGPGQLDEPVDVDLATDGSLYVVDRGNHRIQRFAADGTHLAAWGVEGSAEGQLAEPQGAAVAPDGTVYVADSKASASLSRIQRFTADGTFVAAFGSFSGGAHPLGRLGSLDVGDDGSLYVPHARNAPGRPLLRFAADGAFVQSYTTPSVLDQAHAVAVDGDRLLVLHSSQRVVVLATDGTFLGEMALAPTQAVDVATAPGDRLVTVALDGAIDRFTQNGTWLSHVGSRGSGDPDEPRFAARDVALAAGGHAYVLDRQGRVLELTADGDVVRQIGRPGEAPGQLDDPRGLEVGPGGNLFVADAGLARVQEYTPAGAWVRSFASGLVVPVDVTVAADGTVHVLDLGPAPDQLVRFAPDGARLGDSDVATAERLSAGTDGEVFVLGHDRIARHSADGTLLDTWDNTVGYEYQDLDVGPDGDVYFVDPLFVHRFTSDGTYRTHFGREEDRIVAVGVGATGRVVTGEAMPLDAEEAIVRVVLYAPSDEPATNPAAAPTFADVPADHPFHDDVEWMARQGVSTGYADGTYRPAEPVSRQAMSAFLARLADAPALTPSAAAAFVDVPRDHPFAAAVGWMADRGISTGQDGRFRPGEPVSRQAMSAFLYRFAAAPDLGPPTAATFADVPLAHPFAAEVEWMAQQGVSTGYADGTYRPLAPVTRQAMSAFLHRVAGRP